MDEFEPDSPYFFTMEVDMNKIEEILQEKGRTVFSVGPDATMKDALLAMAANKIGAVLIMKIRKSAAYFLSAIACRTWPTCPIVRLRRRSPIL